MVANSEFSTAIQQSDRRWRNYRRARMLYLHQYVGPYYLHQWDGMPEVLRDSRPLNMIFSTVAILIPHLMIQFPACRCETETQEYEAAARLIGAHQTQLYRRIGLGSTMRHVLLDAMFGAGLTKTALASDGQGGRSEYTPYVDRVDLDDYVLDASCRDREEAEFEGNRYRVSRREIIESGLFSGKEDLIMSLQSTEGNNDRASELTHGPGTLSDSAAEQELVELIDLYYPRRGTIVTVAGGSDPTGEVLGEQDWIGDERGPYSMLGFYWAPDNPMPVPLVSFLVDADHAANTIAVKTIDNARARKSFVLTDQRNPDMGQTIRDIGNGQVAEVPDPSRAQQFTLGGDNVSLYNDLGMLGEWISRLGGNTDLLGGLTADSGTATQDQILLHSSGIRVADMRAQLHEMYSELARKIAWYSFNTDAINETVTVTIPGGVQVNARIGPDKIVGEFDAYSFKVSTYSNAPENPDEEYQSLVEFLQTVVMPLLPVAAAQGADIDAAEIMIKAARARGIEGFGQMIRPAQEQGMPDVQQGPQAGGDQMTINAGSRPSPQPQQMQDSEVA